MRLSLAEAAVRGTTQSNSPSDEALAALDSGDVDALLAFHKANFGGWTMKEEDDADTGGDDDSDSDDDDDDDADDDSDDDDDAKGKGAKKPDAKDRRIQELSAESKNYRLKSSQRGKKIRELEAENRQLKEKQGKPKGKDDGDDDKDGDAKGDDAESKKLKVENEQLQEKLVKQQLRQEFTDLTSGQKPIAKFRNPKAAFRLLDLDDVEIDEDGEIDGLTDAIKALAKSDPYLLDTGKDDDDDDDDSDGKPPVGQPAGRKKGKGNPNRDKLIDKYPALRR